MSWLKAKDWATGVEYSSLFHSGLRAISRRPQAGRARAYSSGSSSQEKNASGGGPAVVSLSTRLPKQPRTRHPSPAMVTDSSAALPPHTPKVARQRPSSMYAGPTKEMTDAWSSEGSVCEIGECPKFREEERRCTGYLVQQIEIDTVRSRAGSRSFYVNFGEMDTAAVPSGGEESFLSLSSDPDAPLHHPIPRRARPASMQMMPRPLPPRYPVYPPMHHRAHETVTRRERSDFAWMLEESSPELGTYELGDEEEELRPDEEHSDLADWRQFHVDWLQTIR